MREATRSRTATFTGSAPTAARGSAGSDSPSPPPAEPILCVRDVHRVYRQPRVSLFRPPSEVHALRGVSFDVLPGQRFGIVGESGSGKSTLLRLLCALDHPTSGTIEFEGRRISGQPESMNSDSIPASARASRMYSAARISLPGGLCVSRRISSCRWRTADSRRVDRSCAVKSVPPCLPNNVGTRVSGKPLKRRTPGPPIGD